MPFYFEKNPPWSDSDPNEQAFFLLSFNLSEHSYFQPFITIRMFIFNPKCAKVEDTHRL